jgi:myo-inositol 2-dehydrogenase/D-chiro-inositol 1-dehydrogenase
MIGVQNKSPDSHLYLDRTGGHSSLPLHFFLERYAESYLNEMQAFVNAVQNQTPVPVSGEDGLMSVMIGLAAARSAKENRPVKVSEIS